MGPDRGLAAASYPLLWKRVVTSWAALVETDCAWLMYSANYLFRTAGVRWTMDPVTLHHRLTQAPAIRAIRDLAPLQLVVLTHRHSDHLDLALLKDLARLPIRWVIPEDVLELIQTQGMILPEQLIVPKPLEPVEINGLRLSPFEGIHDPPELTYLRQRRWTGKRVPSFGYVAEFNGKRWLLPGDVRH